MTDNNLHHHDHEQQIASKVTFGFWSYIMTDFIMFAALFATYAVLHNNIYGGIGIAQVASMTPVLVQTIVMIAISLVFGFSLVALHRAKRCGVLFWLVVTFLLGLTFLGLEFHAFSAILASGYSWQSSAFLSAYFTLLGVHALHVVVGLIWIAILMIQIKMQNLTTMIKTRLICMGLFWNFLTIIWLVIFTVVYLMGAI